jgi:hypothetical protein
MIIWAAIALSILVTGITVLAGRGSIPANGLVGIRTPAVTRNDHTWAAGHRAAVPILTAVSAVVAVAGIAALVAARDSDHVAEVAGLVLFGVDTCGIVVAAVRADAVARRHLRGAPRTGDLDETE